MDRLTSPALALGLVLAGCSNAPAAAPAQTTLTQTTVAPAASSGIVAAVGRFDRLRFGGSLRFDGALVGDLTNPRFVLAAVCGPGPTGFSVERVEGTVGGEIVALWMTVSPYAGPGSYRADSGVVSRDPGPARLSLEPRSGVAQWATKSGTITIDRDERSGSVDVVEVLPPNAGVSSSREIRVRGSWSCFPGEARTAGPFPAATERATLGGPASATPGATLAPGELDPLLAAMETAFVARDWARLYDMMNTDIQDAVTAADFATKMSSGPERIVKMLRLASPQAAYAIGGFFTASTPYEVTMRDTATGTERTVRYDVITVQERAVGWRVLATAERH